MSRSRLVVGVAVGLVLAMMAGTVAAQTPGGGGHGFGPGPFRAEPPGGGGVGIMVMDRDRDRDQLMLDLRLRDCEPQFLAVTVGGAWRVYRPESPAWVNQTFPTQFRAGDAFLVGCTAARPDLRLTEADAGGTVTVEAGDRIRVVLESNASTGYTWTVTDAPNAAVLVPLGQPYYVAPVTDLVGAPGYQVFDFLAVAPGTTSVSLSYVRPTTSEPPASVWSTSVTVE
ncbi:MAG: protease inhibitor I42 family protein [Dehalococcoidia bacterium]